MSFKKLLTIIFTILSFSIVYAQHEQHTVPDSTSLAAILRGGHFDMKVRTFGMATKNYGKLMDNAAFAIGGSLYYESPVLWKRLSFEIGGMFIYNVASTDLGKKDSTTQVKDRYEIGLFDLENTANRTDLDRLDELNLRFHFFKKSKITIGRQLLNTPLINPQDGRMRPSLMSGAWLNITDVKNTTVQGGWLWASSPRSTVRWFPMAESMGVYANGVTTTGEKADYARNLSSKGVFVLGLNTKLTKNWKLSAWNYLIENINNTVFLQTDFEHPLSIKGSKDLKLKAAFQMIHQNTVNAGGNFDQTLTYVERGTKALVFGGRIGLATPQSQLLLNYTRITADGRFTFPREWGRDPLLTFMQRERNEGAGDVKAVNMVFSHENTRKNLQISTGLGYYKLPDVKNYRLNKYGLPSYTQLNLSAKYRFSGYLKNLEIEALVAHKWNQGNLHDDDRYRINKVDMTNYNLIMNYSF
jgi:outer membrane porin, OprD family